MGGWGKLALTKGYNRLKNLCKAHILEARVHRTTAEVKRNSKQTRPPPLLEKEGACTVLLMAGRAFPITSPRPPPGMAWQNPYDVNKKQKITGFNPDSFLEEM